MGQLPKINTEKEDLGVKLSAIENLTNDLEMHSTNKKLGTRWAYQWGAHFCTLAKVDMAILKYGYVYTDRNNLVKLAIQVHNIVLGFALWEHINASSKYWDQNWNE